MSALAWSLPALPLVAGGFLLVGRRWVTDRVAPVVGVGVGVVVLGLALWAAFARPAVRFRLFEGVPAGLAVDGLSAVMVVVVAVVALAVLVYAAGMVLGARFFGLMLVFVGAMLVTVTATDLALLLMGWEVMGAMSYALIGFWWRDAWRVEAADVAFLTTRTGDLGLYLAAGCALAGTGTLELGGLAGAGGGWRDLVAGGVVLAALGKSAQLPFSFWLSRAMAGPSPVSALLHSATMVAAGAYLLLRVSPLLEATGWAASVVAWVGALTALLLGGVALAQRDLKQLLAASTCAQLGFMVLAAGVGGLAGGTVHLVAHAAVKSLLFLCAGAWLTALGTKDLGELSGAARRYRVVGVTFGVGALALAGFPPLSLWFTKDAVLAAAAEKSPWLYAVGLAAGVLSAGYAAKALFAVWRPGGRAGERVGVLEKVPLVVLAVAAVVLGVLGVPQVWGAWGRLLGDASAPLPGVVELVVSGVLAVVVVGVSARWRVGEVRWAEQWFYLERAAGLVVARPVVALARGLARFDDRVVDGGVRAAASTGRALASVADRRIEPRVDGVVTALGAGARRLGSAARRPQTGQVHTYYAQAAVLFAVLVVVVLLVG
ncbi:NADH-quinone oxidoreductase subunit 5 family protein [Actinomadura hibisca]|uniref:NADH-quinone oxidoreductase subunit 5 family protein n=1 Tax=Actinomadura hibisca TaxID=68565 RepID=UPI0008348B91|nr:proton-conducting transporter membrane subunit [Actinomadura hibisca]